MSAPATLESIMRAYGDFHHMFRAMAIYETATGTLLDEEQKQRAVNGFLDAGAPRKAFFCLPGLGDSILLTAVARHAREATGLPCLAVSSHALLFRNSKDVSHVLLNYEALTQDPRFTDFLLQLDIQPAFTTYWTRRMVGARRSVAAPGCHMITHMCRSAGLSGRAVLRPWVERAPDAKPPHLPKDKEYVIFQSDGRPWKHWGTANFQTVANHLRGRFLLVQTGLASSDPPLDGALDIRGKLGLAEEAELMRGARLFIGNEGGLAHLARAVDTKAVLAMSSYLPLAVTGYAANVHVGPEQPCRLCSEGRVKVYKGEPCPEAFRCVDIPLAAVLRGIEQALDDPAMPVSAETIPHPPASYNPYAYKVFEQWFAE